MTLSQIRNRIQALRRKYSLPITVIRLRPYATLFCDEWAIARDRKQPPPDSFSLVWKLANSGFRLPTFTNLHPLLLMHRDNNTCPHPIDIVTALLPDPSSRPIIDAVLRRDPPAGELLPPMPQSPPPLLQPASPVGPAGSGGLMKLYLWPCGSTTGRPTSFTTAGRGCTLYCLRPCC